MTATPSEQHDDDGRNDQQHDTAWGDVSDRCRLQRWERLHPRRLREPDVRPRLHLSRRQRRTRLLPRTSRPLRQAVRERRFGGVWRALSIGRHV